MMDDILVDGKNQYKHDKRLEVVMKRLEEAGMTLNRRKCIFPKNEVIFLGRRVSEKGIASAPEKVKAITKMEAPTNRKKLKSFLGMANYLNKFRPQLAELKRPLES